MLPISLNYLICFVIVAQATNNVNVTTTNTVAATNSTTAANQKGIDPNVQKPIGTIISDSGVTTQNANKSAATVNVIEKPNTKTGMPSAVAAASSNSSNSSSAQTTNDVAKELKRKDGEEVHTRKVTKTEHIPVVALEPQAPSIATNNTKIQAVVAKGATAAAEAIPVVAPAVPPVVLAPHQLPLPSQSAAPSSAPQTPKVEPEKPSPPHPVVIAAKNDTVPTKSATPAVPASTTTGTPKKPLITYSVDDDPDMRAIRDNISKSTKQSHGPAAEANGALNEPVVLQSSELLEDDDKERDYIIPIIGLIFAVPLLLILANYLSRKVRQYWSKRNYQRMDYLINEMYN